MARGAGPARKKSLNPGESEDGRAEVRERTEWTIQNLSFTGAKITLKCEPRKRF